MFDRKSGSLTVPLPELRKIHFIQSVSQNVVKYAYTSDASQTKTCSFQHHAGKENRKPETDTTPPTVPMSINVMNVKSFTCMPITMWTGFM